MNFSDTPQRATRTRRSHWALTAPHAKVELREGRLEYTDLGSSNGTFLNSEEVVEHTPVELSNGDLLILGDTQLQVIFTATTGPPP